MRDHIRFLLNGREQRVGGAAALATLATWLRRDEGATGTKIVCEEGDCGACSVLIRRGGGAFQPVNACILAVAQLDGASVVTVEGLKGDDGALSPLQESMVTSHGAQCGYCTPGFVVAMTALAERGDRLDERAVREGLTGNLCRCTGYEPIIRAALATDSTSMVRLTDRYSSLIEAGDSVLIEADGRLFFAPATLEEAIAFRRDHDPCTIVQGGTDVGVWINKRNFTAPALMTLGKIRELDAIAEEGDTIVAAANATLSAFEEFVEERIPELHGILKIFGSPQIRNSGTLIGNIANGSPIADTLPYLFVAGAELEIAGANGARVVRLDRFYRGYKQFDLQPDEIITRVRVPVVRDTLRLYKVSRRHDLDISAFTAAVRVQVDGGTIASARIAYGGVAPTVVRLPKTEAFLQGKPATLATFESAGAIARGEVKPISDVRGSAQYRAQLAENILAKFWFDAFGATTAPLPLAHPAAPETRR